MTLSYCQFIYFCQENILIYFCHLGSLSLSESIYFCSLLACCQLVQIMMIDIYLVIYIIVRVRFFCFIGSSNLNCADMDGGTLWIECKSNVHI